MFVTIVLAVLVHTGAVNIPTAYMWLVGITEVVEVNHSLTKSK